MVSINFINFSKQVIVIARKIIKYFSKGNCLQEIHRKYLIVNDLCTTFEDFINRPHVQFKRFRRPMGFLHHKQFSDVIIKKGDYDIKNLIAMHKIRWSLKPLKTRQ